KVLPHDLAEVIDPLGDSRDGARHTYRGVYAVGQQKTVSVGWTCSIVSDDLTRVVDPTGECRYRAWHFNRRVVTVVEPDGVETVVSIRGARPAHLTGGSYPARGGSRPAR